MEGVAMDENTGELDMLVTLFDNAGDDEQEPEDSAMGSKYVDEGDGE